ncbi:MAG: tetratricopeptide repeat protein, partial [Gammaproteobacteria bacterium]
DSARGWYWLGLALRETGQLERAGGAFERGQVAAGPERLAAELELARLAFDSGDRAKAIAGFERVVDFYRGRRARSAVEITAAATAAEYLGRTRPMMYQGAVQLYNEAIRIDRASTEPALRLGYLLLDKYNNLEAREVLNEILARDPGNPSALLGLARSQHFDHSNQAEQTVAGALEANPRLVPALVFKARLDIESERYEQAVETLVEALEINPASLEAWATMAAARYLDEDRVGFDEAESKALALNPGFAELYATVADLAAHNRRYGDAVTFASRALELDPYSWRALGLLGTNQLRVGAMAEGRENLEKAFGGDPYNIWIKNLLDLSDTFGEYRQIPSQRFEFMVHGEEAGALEPYLLPLAERTFAEFAERYGYAPPTPVRVELYPRHADFSVRTVGLAGLGILGVSFGPVVAMDSPSARPRGNFNWASTLRHELAHSFHLGMTSNRVPRWFSEGLAVYEERRAGNGWGGDVTLDFLAALANDKTLPLSQLNDGFVRPSYPLQVIHAYYQSSLALEYIETQYGFSAVRSMLDAFDDGATTPEAIERVLKIDIDELDAAFAAHLEQRFAAALAALDDPQGEEATGVGGASTDPPIEESADEQSADATNAEGSDADKSVNAATYARADRLPGNFRAQVQAGRHALDAGEMERAQTYLERAKALLPDYGDQGAPYRELAVLHERRGNLQAAAAELRALVDINAEDYRAHTELARVYNTLEQWEAAADVLLRAVWIYPFDIEVHEDLAAIYARLDDWSAAARERRAVLALEPTDLADARFELARAYFKAGEMDDARHQILRTLEAAPEFEAAKDLRMEIRAARPLPVHNDTPRGSPSAGRSGASG